MPSRRHYDFAYKVMEMLKDQAFSDIKQEDIRLEKFPFHKEPSKGLSISLLTESEGVGLNSADDIRYRVQLTRIKPEIHHSDGLMKNSEWRETILSLFHRERIGFDSQEIITTVRPSTIHMPKEWKAWNIDASVMIVSSLVRRIRGKPPAFTVHPLSQTRSPGAQAVFTTTATTEGVSPITYVWKTRPSTSNVWTTISGATASGYTTNVLTLSDNGRQFKCIATNEFGSKSSDTAVVSVV